MATQKIVLTESELYNIIAEQVNEALQDEGRWNNLVTGTKTFFSKTNDGGGLSGRLRNAQKNYRLQGEYDNFSSLIQALSKFIDDGEIDPQTTVAQLVGGKYNNNKFGKMTGKLNNRMSQMRHNGLSK